VQMNVAMQLEEVLCLLGFMGREVVLLLLLSLNLPRTNSDNNWVVKISWRPAVRAILSLVDARSTYELITNVGELPLTPNDGSLPICRPDTTISTMSAFRVAGVCRDGAAASTTCFSPSRRKEAETASPAGPAPMTRISSDFMESIDYERIDKLTA
jgi:hypothetical protein